MLVLTILVSFFTAHLDSKCMPLKSAPECSFQNYYLFKHILLFSAICLYKNPLPMLWSYTCIHLTSKYIIYWERGRCSPGPNSLVPAPVRVSDW